MQNTDNHSMIHRLTFGEKEIILIGTAHVSKDSALLVKEIIETEKPETVAIELCQSRYQAIRQKNKWQEMDIIKVIKEKKTFLLLSNLLMASFQKRVAKNLGIKPGQEMIQAIETAEATHARIHLADRDIRVTLARIWHAMRWWDKIKLLFQIILSLGNVDEISEKDIEKMKQQDMIESFLQEMGKEMPVLRQILIDERDRYLCHRIQTAPGNKIVAVVGAGHIPGIKSHFGHEMDITDLETLPPKKTFSRLFKWIIPLFIMGIFIAGFIYGGSATGSDMILRWILANGILAGIGSSIALAHPYTIISSVLAAPLTSINPMIAAGWVSGLVEAFARKPRVKDFEALSEDILSVKGFWKNKVTRILLVVVFTNLGSTAGTLVALPLMIRLL